MKKENIKSPAIVFDFGGVLMDWNPYYLYRKYLGDDPQATERFLKEVGFREWNVKHDQGLPISEGVTQLSARFPAYHELIRAYDVRYEETLSGPIQATVDILQMLKEAEYPLYGLSNWPAEKFGLVQQKYPFFSWFEDIVISGEVKMIKPDAEIFQYLLKKIGRSAGDCLFIDDSPANIAAASKLGFLTIHFQSPEKLKTELNQMGLLETSD